MANYFEKISVLIDVNTQKASAGFQSFKTSVKEAEGFTGKFKAGIGSLKESFAGALTGPAGIAAAGTAISAVGMFAYQSAQKFIDLARQTEALGTATGLTNEEASRLLEVFQDLGGDAGALQGALAKIPKSLDSGKWEEYGIATRNAGGELRSTNDILLDGLEALRQIEDPTRRAQAGIDLFGKSWGTLAPLINQSDEAIKDALASVSDAKVMDDKKIASAKKLAAAQDALVDAFDDFALSVGQAVTELAPMIEDMGELVSLVNDLNVEVAGSSLFGWATKALNPVALLKTGYDALADSLPPVEENTSEAATSTQALAQYMDFLRDRADAAAAPLEEMERKLANRRGGVAFAAAQAEQSITDMMDAISDDRQWISVQLAMDDLEERLADLKKQYDDGEIDQREYWLRTRDEILATKGDLTSYLDELDGMDPYLKQRILFEFDQGDIDSVLKMVQGYMDGKQVNVAVGATSTPGLPFLQTGPKDEPYGGSRVTVNIGVVGDPASAARTIQQLLLDYNIATGGIGNAGRI